MRARGICRAAQEASHLLDAGHRLEVLHARDDNGEGGAVGGALLRLRERGEVREGRERLLNHPGCEEWAGE